jgi:predicted transcriptional regulator
MIEKRGHQPMLHPTKQITITLPDTLADALERRASALGYASVESFVEDMIAEETALADDEYETSDEDIIASFRAGLREALHGKGMPLSDFIREEIDE